MKNTDLNKKAGARLKELRLSKNMTQTELAEKLGVTHPTIVRYEKGDVGAMKTSVISALATIFDVSPIYILGMEYKDIDAEPMIGEKNEHRRKYKKKKIRTRHQR